MQDIRIAAAQFEGRNGDKQFNLDAMKALARQAAEQGADIVSFHEVCIPNYSFMRHCTAAELRQFAEPVPDGPSVQMLIGMAREYDLAVLAGLVEADADKLYNTYVCVDQNGFVAKHRKVHAFISPQISCGDELGVFELCGWTCSILTCYDNNIPENVRAVTLMGADIVFMPHVTCCLPWPTPGAGLVDQALWENRHRDPISVRQEFMGPKGREWLLKWVPSRAYDNGVYVVFTNPVGIDDDQVRNGNAMVLDPFGDIIAECNTLGDDIAVGLCTPEKIDDALGRKHLAARRPELYHKLVEPPAQPPVIDPSWDTTK